MPYDPKESNRAAALRYYHRNREACRRRSASYKEQNREEIKRKNREAKSAWREANPSEARRQWIAYAKNNRERMNNNKRAWNKKNRAKINSQRQALIKADPSERLLQSLRRRARAALMGVGKADSTRTLLGISLPEFRQHIENQFSDGMSWDSYGYRGWHLDHKEPCATFDLTDPEQQKVCFHYTNLQPLWALDNLRKGAKCQRRC